MMVLFKFLKNYKNLIGIDPTIIKFKNIIIKVLLKLKIFFHQKF